MKHFTSSIVLGAALLCAIGARPAQAEPVKVTGGSLDFNYYYDTRDLNVYTINTQLKIAPRLEYFSFVNYFNAAQTTRNMDLTSYYMEQNLRWSLPSGLPADLVTQFASSSGGLNDVLRFGGRWKVSSTKGFDGFFKKINTFYAVTFFPVQFDSLAGYQWQIEHVYRTELMPGLLDKRVYLSGFVDQNIGPGSLPWVTEHQLGVRLAGNLYAAVEYRHNAFLKKKDGVGLGLEYVAAF